MAKIILLTGSMVGYAYAMEFFIAWYSANPYEQFVFMNRAFGPYAWAYWIMIACNVITPQLFWFKKIRTNIKALFILSIFVNIGMWFEDLLLLPHLFIEIFFLLLDYYTPTFWDVSLFVGSFGLFFTLFLLFIRFVPIISIAEVKAVLPHAHPHLKEEDK